MPNRTDISFVTTIHRSSFEWQDFTAWTLLFKYQAIYCIFYVHFLGTAFRIRRAVKWAAIRVVPVHHCYIPNVDRMFFQLCSVARSRVGDLYSAVSLNPRRENLDGHKGLSAGRLTRNRWATTRRQLAERGYCIVQYSLSPSTAQGG